MRALPPALAVLAALLLAAPAAAQIVPQQGIAGVKLKMVRSEVIAAKGNPDAEHVAKSEIIGRYRTMRYGATRISFGGVSADAGVISVQTKDRGERTRSGVGVGSTAAEVRAGVAGVTCRDEFGVNHCWKGSFLPGRRVTDFRLGAGDRVISVLVGFVID